MEMLSSFRGDKHEFCLVVIKCKHVRNYIYIKRSSCVKRSNDSIKVRL